jgi:hypothetical protein
MKWNRLSIKEFGSVAELWDRVAADSAADAPFLLSHFIAPLLRHFARGDEQIVAGFERGEPQVAAIVQRVRTGGWQTFQPSQLPLGAIVSKRGLDAFDVYDGLLSALPGLRLSLGITQLDPLLGARPPEKARLHTIDYIETAWVNIAGTFEDYWDARGKNLRHNIRKQHSKLTEQRIVPRLETLTRPEDVEQVLRDYGALESVGWKASQGTAVHADNPQGRFYREMLEAYCATGQGRLYRYWFNDRVAAIDLCVASASVLVILKTTYDETYQGFSPAFLMRHAAFADLFREGKMRRIEFYGRLMDWHKRWTDESRTLYHANFYRYAWLPRLREKIARMRRPASPEKTADPPVAPTE